MLEIGTVIFGDTAGEIIVSGGVSYGVWFRWIVPHPLLLRL